MPTDPRHARRLVIASAIVLLSASMIVPLTWLHITLDGGTAGAAHVAAFFLVGVLVLAGRSRQGLATVLLLLAWSAALEAGQLLTSRHADMQDVAANFVGICLAYAVAPRLARPVAPEAEAERARAGAIRPRYHNGEAGQSAASSGRKEGGSTG